MGKSVTFTHTAMSNEDEEQAEWVVIGNFNTAFEAEMIRQTLEAEGIPVLTKSDAPGIFGASFQGAVTGGVTLHVPSPELDRAQALLDLSP